MVEYSDRLKQDTVHTERPSLSIAEKASVFSNSRFKGVKQSPNPRFLGYTIGEFT